MSIPTLGLDPIDSKLPTWGYGPDIEVEITILPPGPGGARGKAGGRRVRVRVFDEEGKSFIQEQIFNEDDLNKIQIRVSEDYVLSGKDISVRIQEIKEQQPTRIKVVAHEAPKRQNTDRRVSNRGGGDIRKGKA